MMLVITVSSIYAISLSSQTCDRKNTRSNPNSAEIRSNQEIDKRPLGGGDHPKF
jgi:hypothetical protein